MLTLKNLCPPLPRPPLPIGRSVKAAFLLGLLPFQGWAGACDVAPPTPDSPQGRWESFRQRLAVGNAAAACPAPTAPQVEQRCELIAAPMARVAALLAAAQQSPVRPVQNGKGLSIRAFGLFDGGIWMGHQINLYPAGQRTRVQWTNLPSGSAAARLLAPLDAELKAQRAAHHSGSFPCRTAGLRQQQFAPLATCRTEVGGDWPSTSIVLTVSRASDDSLEPGVLYRYSGWTDCGPMFFRSP